MFKTASTTKDPTMSACNLSTLDSTDSSSTIASPLIEILKKKNKNLVSQSI